MRNMAIQQQQLQAVCMFAVYVYTSSCVQQHALDTHILQLGGHIRPCADFTA